MQQPPNAPDLEISAAETARRLEAGEIQLVDVREQEEWDGGRPSGAVHIPMQEVPARLGELDADKPIACLCLAGARSAMVADFLNAQGFRAHNVTGGFLAWFQEHLPTEPEKARVVPH